MNILVIVLFAVPFFQQGTAPAPRSPQPIIAKQESTKTDEQKTSQNSEATHQPSIATKTNPATNPSNPSAPDAAPSNEERPIRIVTLPPITTVRDTPTFIISLVLAGVGITGIIVAICTLKIIGRQTTAIEKQAQAMINGERAWLLVEKVRGVDNGGISMGYFPVIMNFGKTTARIKKFCGTSMLVAINSTLAEVPDFKDAIVEEMNFVLYPKGEIDDALKITVNYDIISNAYSGAFKLYL
jgi:hypothetical protein